MTNEKAIEMLKKRLNIPDYRDQIPEYYETMEMAVQALEKQIPKKVNTNITTIVKVFDGENKVETFKCVPCPICGKWIVKNESTRYCSNCGQKLKWD
ncbi:MAG: hypothetical protein ACOX1S_05450 [Anaerostipes sp.]